MYTLELYNTEKRALQKVTPLDGKAVRLYTCGPTVYDFAHIGNFRTFVFEDALRRAIKFFGMRVNQVMNLTDVDDKTIKGALQNKISLTAFTKRYKDAFFEDLATLNIERVEYYPAATEFIPQMIVMIEKLLAKNVAYKGSDGSVYFAIRAFPQYGKLSHLKLDELKQGISSSHDEYAKESASDFVLWKAYEEARDGDIFWESPFGRGRPGWHLECSAMAQGLLGDTVDIHAGGVDLIFPHHENEIAQSECCSGTTFSNIWVHAEHLLVDNKKMSKSLGNFYTLRDLLQKGYSGMTVRMMLLQTHYRTQLNFTFQGLDGAKSALSRINDFIVRLETYQNDCASWDGLADLRTSTLDHFSRALGHDLNVSDALSSIFEMIRVANTLADEKRLSTSDAKELLNVLQQVDQVLGVCSFTRDEVPAEIQRLVDERQKARASRDFKRSDEIRSELLQKGYVLEDTPAGIRVKKA